MPFLMSSGFRSYVQLVGGDWWAVWAVWGLECTATGAFRDLLCRVVLMSREDVYTSHSEDYFQLVPLLMKENMLKLIKIHLSIAIIIS